MFTPAATAARIASRPEWKYVPSPRFWNMCGRSVKGAMPIQVAPSPPIWVGGSGGAVGQPDRHGVAADAAHRHAAVRECALRCCAGSRSRSRASASASGCCPARRAADFSRCRRSSSAESSRPNASSRLSSASAMSSGDRSPSERSSGSPAGVVLPDRSGRRSRAQVVQDAGGLRFDEGALFLDHQHFAMAAGEVGQRLRFHRPGQRQLQHADAQRGQPLLVQPEHDEGLAQVGPGFPAATMPRVRCCASCVTRSSRLARA